MTLSERIKERAVELGFDLVGIAPARRAIHADAYTSWLQQQFHGEMRYLARDPERRSDPRKVLEGAQSLVVCGMSYFTEDPPAALWDDPLRGRIARYAWGRDYHKVLTPKLKELGKWIEGEAGLALPVRWYVDTGPVLERDFGEQAGLGFTGKNTLLINPRRGSYLFLGEILVPAELDYDEPTRETAEIGCGSCTRCLEACPTHAFPAERILDSRLCISYLTIELRGSIPLELRPKMGNWIFGCDDCQSVCPWVRKFSGSGTERWLKPEPDWMTPRLDELMTLDENGFLHRFAGTPMMRTKRRGLLRNAAVALGNSGRPEAVPVLEQAMNDPDELVREHVAWALEQV